ncbi:hypothetical protein NBH19_08995 [Rhizobium sp. S95]|uniref:Uncharacterized protein n=1 Tax=Ciceribacter sichuanensis TaxID=2949647 RepID=A0AAJ1F5D2_9HYPH|nr:MULTISPECIES: hypothetical protein [unclassified Ciceribacter]MCM2396214.1 hypothetical protein [Ciceribacter sp. S95]MCO5957635.1 hypothetical protein [Ciceribacter sp. S101]
MPPITLMTVTRGQMHDLAREVRALQTTIGAIVVIMAVAVALLISF